MIKKVSALLFISGIVLALSSCAPVTISSEPSGAKVYSADGTTLLGTTPFDTRVFVSDKPFVIKKDRYFDVPVTLHYDSERNETLKLRPAPMLVYSKPIAQIVPAGSDTPIGNTPMKVAVAEEPRSYTLKATDYYDKEISVSVDAPDPLVVELARRPIVTISAEPEGVQIYENDQLIGTAPMREEILQPRVFELRKENYFTQKGMLKGAPPYEFHAVLRPFPVITVSASPANARISRKGSLIGTGSAKLPIGEGTSLKVSADRYYTQSITLTPESDAAVKVALKAMPYVMINSEPAGADVKINGKSIGVTPVEKLIEKDTVVELSKEGFIAQTATLTGKESTVKLTLEAVLAPMETNKTAKAVAAENQEPVAEGTTEASSKMSPLVWVGIAAAAAVILIIVLMAKKKK